MVNEQGRVKVLDFGLAKLIEPVSGSAATHTAATQTREGAILGTVSYMAPEQAEGKPVDQRADIFSFGAVLDEMLSGVQPFRRDSDLGRSPPSCAMSLRRSTPRAFRSLSARW